MCYKCGNTGHYSNNCDEKQTAKATNKKGSNLLVVNDNQHNYSLDEDGNKDNLMPPSLLH